MKSAGRMALPKGAARTTLVKAPSNPETSARIVLGKNLKRTRSFTEIYFAGSTKPTPGQKRGPGQPSSQEKELLRAAVVFSIGALDAYLSEVSAEVLLAQLATAGTAPTSSARTLLQRVIKDIPTLPLELALTTDSNLRLSAARKALLDYLSSNVSNHGAKAVASSLERMGEPQVSRVWDPLNHRLSEWPRLATSGRKAADVLDHWTVNRHKIVHEGVAVRVNGDQVRQLVDFIEALGDAIDGVAVRALSKGGGATAP